MQAACARPLRVHRTPAGVGTKELAVAIGTASQGENAVPEIEMLNEAQLAKAFGDLLGFLMLGFKGVHQLQTHQIGQLDFYRHGAAVRSTVVAQPIAVTRPGFQTIHIHKAD
jgi:hypothetical protein